MDWLAEFLHPGKIRIIVRGVFLMIKNNSHDYKKLNSEKELMWICDFFFKYITSTKLAS